MTLQEEQEREMAILQQINLYQMDIYQKEVDIALTKQEMLKLDWQLNELRNEFRNDPSLDV